MKNKEIADIKHLLNKYDDGKTSLEEERLLADYFSQSEVPEELLSYQAEFTYYTNFKKILPPSSPVAPIHKPGFHTLIKSTIAGKISVIIGVLITASFVIYFLNEKNSNEGLSPSIEEVIVHDSVSRNDTPIIETAIDSLKENNKKTPVIVAGESATEDEGMKSQELDSSYLVLNDSIAVEDSGTAPSPINLIVDATAQPMEEKVDQNVKKSFTITQNSSSGQLQSIAYYAKKARIDYTYVVDRSRKLIHEINVVMIIKSTGKRSQLWITVPKKGQFSETLWWSVDEKGNAVSLSDSKIAHEVAPKHPIE